MKKRMIWNNDVCSEIDTLEKDGFFAESEITSEEEKMDVAYEHINTALNDEAYNLSIDAGGRHFSYRRTSEMEWMWFRLCRP